MNLMRFMENDTPILIDSFGRVHDYLRISLTERCNLRCFYCMPEEGIPLKEKAQFMSSEEMISIASQFVELGIKKIRLTGGEPFLKKDIDQILRKLSEFPIEIGITTNAILLDKYFPLLKECGIKSLNVSLDSLNEKKFNEISRRNFFTRIYANILEAIRLDFKVKVNVVVIRGVNDHEIIDFVEWSSRYNVEVRFIEFMPFDGNQWNWEKKVSQKEMLEIISSHFGDSGFYKVIDRPNDTSRNYKLLDGQGRFGFISSVTNPFCDTCNRIRLTADGRIKNCLFSQEETDLLSQHRLGRNIKDLIRQTVVLKHQAKGGVSGFDSSYVNFSTNRSMVSIGG
jgi:molybdenum cofactor biosynthesis protein A